MTAAETACPVCGANGVTGCDTPTRSDHPGRPPFFSKTVEAALRIMSTSDKGTPPEPTP